MTIKDSENSSQSSLFDFIEEKQAYNDKNVNVCGYYQANPNKIEIDVTSRSQTWSQQLSPFYLRNIKMPSGISALIMENAWQFSKVFPQHTDKDNNPTDEYFKWANNGFALNYGVRHPMGKGSKPSYSYWKGKHLSYVDARQEIYIPLYRDAVRKPEAFRKLKHLYLTEPENLVLKDFDGYDYKALNMTLKEVLLNPNRSCGHGFVLAMMLEYGDNFSVDQIS